MNYIFVFMLLSAILHSTCGLTMDELAAVIAKDQKQCLRISPIPPEIRDQLNNHVLVEDYDLKQYALCMHTLIGFINPDGSYNVEVIMHTISEVMGNHQYDSLIEECTKNPTSDALNNSWNLAKCAHDNVHNTKFFQFVDAFWSLPK